MVLKIDIRILSLSIAIHIAIYFLLELSLKVELPAYEVVEIDYKDTDTHSKQIQTLQQKVKKETEKAQPRFLGQQETRFKREMVSRNLGVTQNQIEKLAQKRNATDPQKPNNMDGFLPLPTGYKTNEDPRKSAVSFEVPHLAKGDFTFLNSDFSSYATFYSRITPPIVTTWSGNVHEISMFPHMIEKLAKKTRWTTVIQLVLNNKGYFEEAIVERSSGSQELDAAVVQSLREAAPFLNPPSGMVGSDGKVRIDGEFTVYTRLPRIAR